MKATILCGISGSGKSSFARENYPDAMVVSADNFFVRPDGTYAFDVARLSEAHATCLRRWIDFLRAGCDVVCDNTNTTTEELAPYVATALAYGADVEVIVLDCPVDVAAARNVHGVPYNVVAAQAARLAKLTPPRFGGAFTRKQVGK